MRPRIDGESANRGRGENTFDSTSDSGRSSVAEHMLLTRYDDQRLRSERNARNTCQGRQHCLHYVTAREMYNIARAAEAGESGDPGGFRDYRIQRPGYRAGTES